MPGLGARRDLNARGRKVGLPSGRNLRFASVLEQKHCGGDHYGYDEQRYQGALTASRRRLASVDCFTSTCQSANLPITQRT
ncbi:hypothetical protein GMST_18270 [Geomonas silvestris]|uniref:Uncharacterized protein n=1 Tax=Geomonas silvestris TaxID=2740184 RepID=A0A6V8MHS4_9BACT|nr:hypothetical protein GMST_18270 [Geomonas silvestris]